MATPVMMLSEHGTVRVLLLTGEVGTIRYMADPARTKFMVVRERIASAFSVLLEKAVIPFWIIKQG